MEMIRYGYIRNLLLGAAALMSAALGSCSYSNAGIDVDYEPAVYPAPDVTAEDTAKVVKFFTDINVPELSFPTVNDALVFMHESGHFDEYQTGIILPMLEENLDYATKLLSNTHDKFLIVDKGSMKVKLYDKYGNLQKSYGMACAKNYGTKHHKADSRTPEGFFSVKSIHNSTDWLYTDDNGVKSDKKGQFGPRFIRLRIPTTNQIGIHGTCAPWSIGHRSSHGCIRLTNENILELVTLVEKGMPVIVNPGLKDESVNREEGYNIPRLDMAKL